MGNKPSVSEGEDEEERTVRINRLTHEIANGGGEDVDDEVELPPPMKPIQEPILVGGGATTSAVPPIEENPSKRVNTLFYIRGIKFLLVNHDHYYSMVILHGNCIVLTLSFSVFVASLGV